MRNCRDSPAGHDGWRGERPAPSVVAGYAPVVKLHVVVASGLPARSVMPFAPPVTVTVYCVFAVSVPLGSRIHLFVVPLRVTVALTAAPPVGVSVNVVMLTFATASLKVAVMLAVRLTPVAPEAGTWLDTFGAGPVRNSHVSVVNEVPVVPRMPEGPPVRVTVYRVSCARLAEGLNVHLFPLRLNTPATAHPPAVGRTVNVVLFTFCTAPLKVAVMFVPTATAVAPGAGVRAARVTVPVPPPLAVVKVQVYGFVASPWFALSLMPDRVAVYWVFAARSALGSSVAVLVVASYVTDAGTAPAAELNVNEVPLTLAPTFSLNVAVTLAPTATLVAPAVGEVDVTVGAGSAGASNMPPGASAISACAYLICPCAEARTTRPVAPVTGSFAPEALFTTGFTSTNGAPFPGGNVMFDRGVFL